MSESEIILRAEHLNSYYEQTAGGNRLFGGKKYNKQILKDVTFEVRRGEILGLVGESGCGKTTIAGSILGFQKHLEGTVTRNCKHIQMVFQDPYSSLNPARTIGWSMEEPLKNNTKLSAAERKQRVAEMLTNVELDPVLAERYPEQLSGGQRQRVCIGIALMLSPEFLIADEPVSALDVTIQAQILELLKKLKQEMNLSILFISHDLRVVYEMCDRILIMKDGAIQEEGTPEEVYFSPKSDYTKLLLDSAGLGDRYE
ncbi:MAG: ATP-binding cassette domain-containing protein [Lachnospiraceae bacterium]|nr:ATP-binding cassette domain-containing protein [Lachnospiraceae bacterium]